MREKLVQAWFGSIIDEKGYPGNKVTRFKQTLFLNVLLQWIIEPILLHDYLNKLLNTAEMDINTASSRHAQGSITTWCLQDAGGKHS